MPERSAHHRLLSLLGMDAPSARAASLASSAASRPAPGVRRSGRLDPPGNPPVIPSGIPPPQMAGPTLPRLAALLLVRSPSGGQSAANPAADWPPSGEWCGRAERSASRD
jgi:hypothetical protein